MELLETIDLQSIDITSIEYHDNLQKQLENMNNFFEDRGIENKWIEKMSYNDSTKRIVLFVSTYCKRKKIKEILSIFIYNIK